MIATALVLIAAAALLSAGLIVVLKPLLRRYALARPNARSSHRVPTPQGGGIAVVGAALAVAGAALLALGPVGASTTEAAVVAAAAVGLAAVGAVDDIRPLPAGPRLLLQFLAVAAVVVVAVGDARVLPSWVPAGLERGLLVVAGVWFVNLVNFMDGLDWITVAEMAPVTAALAAFNLAASGSGSALALLGAAALLGALLGFAPFNRPVARLFLGDVGSLPIGLLVGWLLLDLAAARAGGVAAALLLVLYPLVDATLTLLRRLLRRERVWEAHRTHFYQQATDNGFSALEVSARVFALNLALAALAAAVLAFPAPAVQALALVSGLGLVALTLRRFAGPRGRATAGADTTA